MRIAFMMVKNIHRGGGIETYTREVGKRLVARGHEVTVYAMPHHGPQEKMCDGMKIEEVPCIRHASAEKLSSSVTAAARILFRAQRPSVAHLHSVAAGAMAPLLRARGIPCVMQMHGVEWKRPRWSANGQNVLHALERLSVKSASVCTAVSVDQCDYLSRHYGRNVEFIPVGADIREPPAPQEILKKNLIPGRYTLFAARLVREKGVHYLLKAFQKLSRNERLVIAGDANGAEDYKAELKELARGDGRIQWLGHCEGRLLQELFAHARIFVLPSDLEGLSIALLEAMSYGRPCLVSDIAANKEAASDTALTFARGDADDLAQKWAWLIDNETGALAMGNLARSRVQRHFTWDSITTKLEAMYSSVAQPRRDWARIVSAATTPRTGAVQS